MGGRFTFPGGGLYHATKHAVEAISDALRLEVAPFGVAGRRSSSRVRSRSAFVDSAVDGVDTGEGPYAGFRARARRPLPQGVRRQLESNLEVTPEKVADVIVTRRDGHASRGLGTPSARWPRRSSPRAGCCRTSAWDGVITNVWPTPRPPAAVSRGGAARRGTSGRCCTYVSTAYCEGAVGDGVLADLARDAERHRPRRHLGVVGHERAGAHQRARCARPPGAARPSPSPMRQCVLDGAPLEVGVVPHDAVVADHGRRGPAVQWTTVPSWTEVRAPTRCVPWSPRSTAVGQTVDSGPMRDVADDDRVGVHEGGRGRSSGRGRRGRRSGIGGLRADGSGTPDGVRTGRVSHPTIPRAGTDGGSPAQLSRRGAQSRHAAPRRLGMNPRVPDVDGLHATTDLRRRGSLHEHEDAR